MKKVFNKALFLALLLSPLLFYFLFLPKQGFAATSYIWHDEFNGTLSSDWQLIDENNTIVLEPSEIKLTAPSGHLYPYFFTQNALPTESLQTFTLEIKLKYFQKSLNFGAGIVLGNSVYHNRIYFSPPATEGLFKIWPRADGSINFISNLPDNSGTCQSHCSFYVAPPDVAASGLILKIDYTNGTFNATVNGHTFKSAHTAKKLTRIWIGNPEETMTTVVWPSFSIDYIRITSGEEEKPVVVFLPGLGGSWNTEAILLGQKRPQSEWQLTPLAEFYRSLIDTLTHSNTQFYPFYYDWRQHISETTAELDTFLHQHIPAGRKVALVGHSLGGVVARAYLQQYDPQAERVAKVITLGSPHQGAVQAYEALAGGKAYDRFSWVGVANKLLLTARSVFYTSPAEVVRQEAPGFQDIVPTFDFIKRNRRLIPASQIHFANNFLPALNQDFQAHNYPVEFFVGENGINTPRWLWFRSQTSQDKFWRLWPDGSPRRVINSPGDGTVATSSAALNQHIHHFNFSHHQLASEPAAIQEIMNLLGLSGQIIEHHPFLARHDTLVFLVGSPVTLHVTDSQGVVHRLEDQGPDNQGFITIPHPSPGEFTAQLTATASGTSHLLLARLTPQGDYYNYYRAPVQPGETETYHFAINFQNPRPAPLASFADAIRHCQDELALLRQNHQSGNLNDLDALFRDVLSHNHHQQEQDLDTGLAKLFAFRRENLAANQLASRALVSCFAQAITANQDDLGANNRTARREYYRTRRYFSLTNRLFRLWRRRHRHLNDVALQAFREAKDYLAQARQDYRQHHYSSLVAQSRLARRLLGEALRSYRR